MVIYHLDHAMDTMPEKLDKMDFNFSEFIDPESLLLSFGDVEL